MTLDGIIAKDVSQNVDWTSQADKKSFVAETKKHGVIILGRKTYQVIGRPLPKRLNLIATSTPEEYKEEEIPNTLEFTKGTPQEIIELLEEKGFKSAVLGGGPTLNAAFLKAGVVDEVLITIEPKIFGVGLNFTEGEEFNIDLQLIESKEIGDNAVQLRYKVIK